MRPLRNPSHTRVTRGRGAAKHLAKVAERRPWPPGLPLKGEELNVGRAYSYRIRQSDVPSSSSRVARQSRGLSLYALLDLRTLVKLAVLHDRKQLAGILQNGDIRQWIAVDQQDVCQIAGFNLTELVAHHHDLAAVLGGGHDRVHRREAEQVDEVLDVAGVAADRIPGKAVVTAGEHTHPAPLELLHILDR